MYLSSPGDRIPDEPPFLSRNIQQLFQAVFLPRPCAGGSGRLGGSWAACPGVSLGGKLATAPACPAGWVVPGAVFTALQAGSLWDGQL